MSTTSWPTPEQAYAHAPDIATEEAWLTHTSNDWEAELDRKYGLRLAAYWDRIALNTPADDEAAESAEACALMLVNNDQHGGGARPPRSASAAEADPCGYVRQQYRAWRRADLTASGRCPNCGWLTYQCNCADHPDA
ncbi:hypothetical protein LHJ74_05330 [Streptomyces sp. N2-109]|uniref:Uncharacterized protein n=1 Tax=Streptomyces gossypii TaxID=2883101 RepID=A0ABT2JNP5_9ACTN|nr:hypothetical protein [Streptomyces gossypii]MCT2589361.1 hypothetical protein [Streptomyces gossypii]